MMFLDDRATDRKPDTHTAAFGDVEGFEQLLEISRIDTVSSQEGPTMHRPSRIQASGFTMSAARSTTTCPSSPRRD
jgi:hypothetical protein